MMLSLAALSYDDPGTSGYDDSCEHPEASHGRLSAHVRVPPMSEGARNASELAHGGECPPSERECLPCPAGEYKCPQGGCRANIRDCTPNVFIRGACDGATCNDIEWCHLYGRPLEYACWEIAGSEANATMTFGSLERDKCGWCLGQSGVLSHYPCELCCGAHATAAWSGAYETADPGRQGGGLFMEGTRWACLLKEVAARYGLANSAANLEAPVPPTPPPPPSPPSPPPPPDDRWQWTESEEARALLSEYDL